MKDLIANAIILILTILLTGAILTEIYFIFCIVRNKRLEKKYQNDLELQKILRKQNEEFWKNRHWLSL